MGEHIKFTERPQSGATPGSAGLQTQVAGGATTVSAAAAATGGMGGTLIERDL